MKSIIIENINQYNFIKIRLNHFQYNYNEPRSSLILNEKKIKHQTFDTNKIYTQLYKTENILNKYLFIIFQV